MTDFYADGGVRDVAFRRGALHVARLVADHLAQRALRGTAGEQEAAAELLHHLNQHLLREFRDDAAV
jgi:hypothetical protein